jgi:hypothetical protein
MSKRSPEDILKDIEDAEVDDPVDRVLAMSPEERQRELEAAGFTATELDAKADALYERMQQAGVDEGKRRLEAEARARSLRPPARGGRRVLLLAAAAFAAIVLALLLFPRRASRETPMAIPSATARPSSTMGGAARPPPSAMAADATPPPPEAPPPVGPK